MVLPFEVIPASPCSKRSVTSQLEQAPDRQRDHIVHGLFSARTLLDMPLPMPPAFSQMPLLPETLSAPGLTVPRPELVKVLETEQVSPTPSPGRPQLPGTEPAPKSPRM